MKLISPEQVKLLKTGGDGILKNFSEHQLSNGLRVLLIPDSRLPVVSYQMLVKAGYVEDPVGQSGIAIMVASLLNKGIRHKNANQIADEIALKGSQYGTVTEADYSLVYMSGLSKYKNDVLTLFADIVTSPTFTKQEMDRLNKQLLASLSERSDNPGALANFAFQDYLFGPHPYGRSPLRRRQELNSISRSQLIRFYLENYRPNNSMLAVVGDFGPDILSQLESHFKSWTQRKQKPVTMPSLVPIEKLQLRLVQKKDLTQAQIHIGHYSVPRNHVDYLALRLANTILGQGFTSRLVDKIRDNLGLTYSISSNIDSEKVAGVFEISTFARNEKVGEVIQQVLKILREFAAKGVTKEELENAKGYFIGSFGRSIETPERLASALLGLRFYGISDSYLTHFEEEVESVSLSDLNRVIRTHFHPDKLKILVLANESAVESSLTQFAPYEKIPYTQLQ